MRGGSAEAVAVARDVASSSPSKPTSALDMMRYQRISSDCLPLANGGGSGGSRKSPAPAPRSSMDDAAPAVASDSSRLVSYLANASLEANPRSRAPHLPLPTPASSSAAVAAARNPARDYGHTGFPEHTSQNPNGSGAGPDAAAMVLQWGHNKRSRGRRDAAAAAASASALTPSQLRRQASLKIQRRASAPAAAAKLMPPPVTRGPKLRVTSSLPSRAATAADTLHGRSAALPHQRSTGEQLQSAATAKQRPAATTDKALKAPEAGVVVLPSTPEKPKHRTQAARLAAAPSKQQPSPTVQKLEVPRVVTTLSRREKEEDFMAMKGTKLPQRPKKRSKAAEKAVNFICPGMWLEEVTRSKYEVREKKCKKQKRRGGLKGMESSDSD